MKIKTLALFVFLLSAGAQAEEVEPNSAIDGIYEMTIKIGTKTYLNNFVLTGKTRPINVIQFGGQIAGSFGIPGQFSSLLDGNGRCTIWNNFCQFQFSVLAYERGRSSKVTYKAEFIDPEYSKFVSGESQQVVLTGSAFRENGEILGRFKAIRNK